MTNADVELNRPEMEIRFTYHKPTEGQPELYKVIRDQAYDVAMMLQALCPQSRELSLAITKLEESVMWANAAIARRSENRTIVEYPIPAAEMAPLGNKTVNVNKKED